MNLNEYYFFLDYSLYESPWPFLVSTASLFLTLDAVLFFKDDEFVVNLISFMSLVNKTKPKILYLGGSVLSNHVYNQYKYYSFRPIGIGKAKWNPENYSKETQIFIDKLKIFLETHNHDAVYDIMYAILGNKNGFFSQNFGKVTSVVNNMISAYNKENSLNPITEKGFLNYYKFDYSASELVFLDDSNRGTVMSNINEILAPKIFTFYNQNMIVERCISVENKVNLSFQKNPEYTVGLFVKNSLNQPTVVIYDSDLKITEDFSLNQKYLDLVSKQNTNITLIGKENFGMNIVIVASRNEIDSELILDKNQVDSLVLILKKLSLEYPDQFQNFNENSKDFVEFIKTGKTSILNQSNFPVVRYYRPSEFYKLSHDKIKFDQSSAYKTVVDQISKRECINENINFNFINEINN